MKQLKNVILSSKSAFNPQELLNSSEDANKKLLKNVELSSKSASRLREHRKSNQNHNINWTYQLDFLHVMLAQIALWWDHACRP
jgi:hypothetical protein